jgi:NADH-quinone oxidoreductase subunit J
MVLLLFALLTVVSAFALALTRKLVYAAFMLFSVLFGVAALFVLAGAEFLAVGQILVYVGGILILVIFGIMLTDKQLMQQPRTELVNLPAGILIAGGLMAVFGYMAVHVGTPPSLHAPAATVFSTKELGVEIFSHYMLPFELVSVLLLVALVGAAYIARRE